MRWKGRRQSDAVEDRRGQGMGRPLAIGGIGTLVVIGIALFLGADPSQILNMLGQMQGAGPAATEQGPAPGNDEARQFVATVLADTEEVWGDIFEDNGRTYQRPRLILYSGRTEMPGGVADAATGATRRTVVELKGERHPHIDIKDEAGVKVLEDHYLPSKSQIEIEDGEKVQRGTILARTPRNVSGTLAPSDRPNSASTSASYARSAKLASIFSMPIVTSMGASMPPARNSSVCRVMVGGVTLSTWPA